MRKAFMFTLVSPLLFLLLGSPAASAMPAAVPAAVQSGFSSNWVGGVAPAAPVVYRGDSNWDVAIHARGPGNTALPTLAQHGATCAGYENADGSLNPNGTHVVTDLADSVYICNNHLMTSLADNGYAQTTLTPNQIVDFSAGTATITWKMSTRHDNARDWIALWLTPFDQNLLHPFTDAVDLQGPPKNAVDIIENSCCMPTQGSKFSAYEILNYGFNQQAGFGHGVNVGLEQAAAVSTPSNTRTAFELDISTTHIRFGIPAVNWWVIDNDFPTPLPFNQAIFQVNHDSYDPCKDQGSNLASPCKADTWHWSDFTINPSVPFTMMHGDQRSFDASSNGAVAVNFQAAPAGSMLRFEEAGAGLQLSFDGGATWLAPQVQQQNNAAFYNGPLDLDRFTSYWQPVPAGTTKVLFKGQHWWGGPAWVRDPSFWARTAPPPGQTQPPVQTNPPAPPAGNPPGHSTPPPVNNPKPPTGGGASGGSGESGASGGGSGENPSSPAGGEHANLAAVTTAIEVRLDAAIHSPNAPMIGVLGLFAIMLLVFVRSILKNP
jgi:hypothetical protein